MQLRCAACGRAMIIREKLEEGDVVTCPNCGKETTYRPSAPAPATSVPASKPGAPAANAPKPAGGGLTGVPTRLSKPEPTKRKEDELPSGGGHGCLTLIVFLVLVGAAAWGCRQFYPAGWQQAVQLVEKIRSQIWK
jgi:DNA-directed RNA polymerase subunit RPC12/RpoP